MTSLVRLLTRIADSLKYNLFPFNRIEPVFAINTQSIVANNENSKSIIDDIMSNGLVWATQKKRRTVEMRLRRRFGVERYPDDCQIIRPKQNITVCDNCGQYHQIHTICGNCYEKVKEETKLIQEAIRKQFGSFEPVEQEVAVVYRNEKDGANLEGRRIVEMERERPSWFAKNLLSKTGGSTGKWKETNVVPREQQPSIKD